MLTYYPNISCVCTDDFRVCNKALIQITGKIEGIFKCCKLMNRCVEKLHSPFAVGTILTNFFSKPLPTFDM